MHDLATMTGAPALEPAVMIGTESGAGYDDLYARLRASVKPADVVEEIWVREVAELTWEAIRLRRLKAQLMRVCAHEGLTRVLSHITVGGNHVAVAERWSAGDEAAAETVNAALERAGFTLDAAMALTLSERLDDIERIGRMAANAAAQRDASLREIELRRAGVAARLRRAMDEPEDAEFEVIAPAAGRA
jgi:hypothetical protein